MNSKRNEQITLFQKLMYRQGPCFIDRFTVLSVKKQTFWLSINLSLMSLPQSLDNLMRFSIAKKKCFQKFRNTKRNLILTQIMKNVKKWFRYRFSLINVLCYKSIKGKLRENNKHKQVRRLVEKRVCKIFNLLQSQFHQW